MTATCLCCYRDWRDGGMCPRCESRLLRELRAVPDLITELETTRARQDRVTEPGPGGLARERWGYRARASDLDWVLENVLTTWARDVSGETWQPATQRPPAEQAADYLRDRIRDIRRHPAVDELYDQVLNAIHTVRSACDQPSRRTITVGPCPEECDGEVVAILPTDDDRPSRMQCKAAPEHKWTTQQFFRAGERIRKKMEQQRKETAA